MKRNSLKGSIEVCNSSLPAIYNHFPSLNVPLESTSHMWNNKVLTSGSLNEMPV